MTVNDNHIDPLEEGVMLMLRLRESDDPGAADALRTWMSHHPSRREELAKVAETWSMIDRAGSSAQVAKWRQQALVGKAPVPTAVRSRRWLPAIAAAIATVAALGIWTTSDPRMPDKLYQTTAGQRATVRLADNSVVMLDAGSRIEVSFDGESRHIRLMDGQAFFKVAHDPRRPFTVWAQKQEIRALGTAFNVDTVGTLSVSLVQGSVRVASLERRSNWLGKTNYRADTEHAVILSPGERLVAGNGGRTAVLPFDPKAITAWEKGQLVFDEISLEDAIVRVNHYSNVKISLRDANLRRETINGVFRTGDSISFVSAILAYHKNLEAVKVGPDHIELRGKAHREGVSL